MPTNKKRILISVSKPIEHALARLAKRDQMPQAAKASNLLEMALEIEEDLALDREAVKRDAKNTRFLSHKDAWA